MRDWEALVRRQLAGIALEAEERREVIEELAAHLEEACAELCKQGMTEEAAARRALSQVTDWHKLRRKIQTARMKENIMSNRVTQLWVPGLLTFTLSMVFLAVFQIFGPPPWILAWYGRPPIALFHIPWFLSLPLIGAMGAYLSYRAGGSKRMVVTSIVFPVLPILAALLFVIPVSLVVDRHIDHNIMPMAFVMLALGWVLIPGVALLAGGLPMQHFLSRRLDSRRIVSN